MRSPPPTHRPEVPSEASIFPLTAPGQSDEVGRPTIIVDFSTHTDFVSLLFAGL
jgi:hypothetical protein